MKTTLIELYHRDLTRLEKEIKAYTNDKILWQTEKAISNSGGNLALHILGNLNHFIGSILGNTGYIRAREGEFNDKNISREHIYSDIDELKAVISEVIANLDNQTLAATYPLNVFKKEMSTEFFLIHLYGHLNYHLGQINYHRRLLDNC